MKNKCYTNNKIRLFSTKRQAATVNARNVQIETSIHNGINKPRAVFIALTVYQIKFYYFISGHMSYHRVINSCRLYKTNTSIVWRTIRSFLFRYQNKKSSYSLSARFN